MATKTNVVLNGHSYYRLQKTVGHEIRDGKKVPIRKQFLGKSKKQAEQKYEEWKAAQNTNRIDCTRSVGELAEQFCANLDVDSSYSIGTRQLYRSAYERMLKGSEIARRPINSIGGQDIQLFYNTLNKTDASIRTLHKFMRLFVKWMELSGYCGDLMRLVVIPDKTVIKRSNDIIIWTDDEIEMIEERLTDYELYPLIMLGLYAGCRISEALGLKWSDIKDDKINIVRQNYRGQIVPPKAGSYRVVPLHSKIKSSLEDREHKHEYIFCSASGQLLDYSNVTRSLRRAYNRAGIPCKKFHAYRATFCTRLCKAGVPIQVASQLMGHGSISVTAKFYTHIEEQLKADAISKL